MADTEAVERALDEDTESRRQINQALDLTPAERIQRVAGTYAIYLHAQRRLGAEVFDGEAATARR